MTPDYTKALIDSLSPPHTVTIDYVDFSTRNAKLGAPVSRMDWQYFVGQRRSYASMPFGGGKADLPAQMGALANYDDDEPTLCRKREEDIQGQTWLFIDCDNGGNWAELLATLKANNIAYLLTESASSRVKDATIRWHLFLPLAQIVIYPSTCPLESRKAWWKGAVRAAKEAIWAIGGIEGKDDESCDNINRIAYVPRLLPGRESSVFIAASTDTQEENRCIDLAAFLRGIGYASPEPPKDNVPAGRSDRDPVASSAQGDPASSAESSALASSSTTPGETTGTLLYKVFAHTGRILQKSSDGRIPVKCPWESEHSGAGSLTSTVIFVRGEGGFECKHMHCEHRQAAEVLRWGRMAGVPLPDRTPLGASVVEAIEAVMTPEAEAEVAAAVAAVAVAPVAVAPVAIAHAGVEPSAAVVAAAEPAVGPSATPIATSFFLAPAKSAPPPTTAHQVPTFPLPSERLKIQVTMDVAGMRDDAIKAISKHPFIVVAYKQGTPMLCDLIEHADVTGQRAFVVRKLGAAHLKAELCRVSTWFKRDKDEAHWVKPDADAISAVLTVGSWPSLRRIRGIVGTPVFRQGGTLIQTPGHDAASGIFYDATQCEFLTADGERKMGLRRISEDPGVADCQHALARLRYVIKDFPCKEPDLAVSVWLSAIFTKLLRFAFSGNVPLFAVTAGASGSGKGKLAFTAAIIASGKGAETISGHLAGESEGAELEREIGTHLGGGDSGILCIDNVKRGIIVGGPVLEAYMTTPTFTTRRIGTSDKIKQEKSGYTDLQMWVTGNDLQLSADMTRRSLIIAIEDLSGDPTARVAEQSDLEGYVTAHRHELLAHALTLLSGFYAARRKGWKANLPDFASFEAWSIVRQAVVWCGLPDPFLARGKAAMSPEDIAFAQLAAHLHAMVGTEATLKGRLDARLVADAKAKKPQHTTFRTWLDDKGIKIGSQGRSIGWALKQHVGKVVTLPSGKFQLHLRDSAAGSVVQLVPV